MGASKAPALPGVWPRAKRVAKTATAPAASASPKDTASGQVSVTEGMASEARGAGKGLRMALYQNSNCSSSGTLRRVST